MRKNRLLQFSRARQGIEESSTVTDRSPSPNLLAELQSSPIHFSHVAVCRLKKCHCKISRSQDSTAFNLGLKQARSYCCFWPRKIPNVCRGDTEMQLSRWRVRVLLGIAAVAALTPIWIVTQSLATSVPPIPFEGYDTMPMNSTISVIRSEGNSDGNRQVKVFKLATSEQDRSVVGEHLHKGVLDSNGTVYVANVHLVRKFIISKYQHETKWNSLDGQGKDTQLPPSSYLLFRNENEFHAACMAQPREGKERKAGWRLLTKKVQVDGPDPIPLQGEVPVNPRLRASTWQDQDTGHPGERILCAIYTYEKRHASVSAIGDTWGWRCDGFFAASTKTVDNPVSNDEGLGAVDLPHKGPEKYENMWQKTRSILSYMHDYYLDDFDFFFLSGDDTFVIVENMRRMIRSLGTPAYKDPLYLGQWIPDGKAGRYYCGGGPGYLLNRKSLVLLVGTILPQCHVDTESPAEDRMLGDCFRRFGILGNHSVDAANAQRFHGMDPHDTCKMTGDSGFFGRVYRFWGEHYGFKTGFNLTSSQSVSFHMLKTPKHLKRIHAILYNSCPPNTTVSKALLDQG